MSLQNMRNIRVPKTKHRGTSKVTGMKLVFHVKNPIAVLGCAVPEVVSESSQRLCIDI